MPNKLATLKQWAWFVLALIVGGAMFVYVFVGPTEPKGAVQHSSVKRSSSED